jgi:hypothetical protein
MKLFEKRNEPEAVDAFWKETEASVGESIIVYGLAKYISGGDEESALWGIAFVTPTRLFFRHFPQQSWITAMMLTSTGDQSDKKSARERDITLSWDLSRFDRLEDTSEREHWLRRFFVGSQAMPLQLIPKGVHVVAEDAQPVVLSVEHNRPEFVKALRKVLSNDGATE